MMEILSEDECNDYIRQRTRHRVLILKYPDCKMPSGSTVYHVIKAIGITHRPNRKPNGITKADREARKSDDLRYEYNYGVGKVEAMTVIMCEGLEFCGLPAITAVSVMKLIHPEEPSELLIYVVLLKVVNVAFDIFFLREQRKITHASENHVTESEYATIAGKLMFDSAALLSLLLVWLLRDIKLSWYAAPGLSLVISAYMFTVCVRHVRHAVNDLLDKTLPEEMQMKILKALTKHDSEYSGFGSVKSRHNGTGINIDIAVFFPPETSFESIVKFQNSIQQELSAEIGECHVAVIIEIQ